MKLASRAGKIDWQTADGRFVLHHRHGGWSVRATVGPQALACYELDRRRLITARLPSFPTRRLALETLRALFDDAFDDRLIQRSVSYEVVGLDLNVTRVGAVWLLVPGPGFVPQIIDALDARHAGAGRARWDASARVSFVARRMPYRTRVEAMRALEGYLAAEGISL